MFKIIRTFSYSARIRSKFDHTHIRNLFCILNVRTVDLCKSFCDKAIHVTLAWFKSCSYCQSNKVAHILRQGFRGFWSEALKLLEKNLIRNRGDQFNTGLKVLIINRLVKIIFHRGYYRRVYFLSFDMD